MISKLFKSKKQRQREREIDRALKRALRDEHEETIIEITKYNEQGWANGTEILNTVTMEELKSALKRVKRVK